MSALFPYPDAVIVDGLSYTPEQVIAGLFDLITPERRQRIHDVVSARTFTCQVVLEDIYDRGNISAVMRSSEAMGFQAAHIIEKTERYKKANRVSLGAEKWLDIHRYKTTRDCLQPLRDRGLQILATDLNATHSLDEIDFSKPTAFILGNEKEGVSSEALTLATHRVRIPMAGFVQSFNISVAGALLFYHIELWRKQHLGCNGDLLEEQQLRLEAEFYLRSVAESSAILKLKRSTSVSLGS